MPPVRRSARLTCTDRLDLPHPPTTPGLAMTFPLSLPLPLLVSRRTARRARPDVQPDAAVHRCQGQMRVRTVTEDGRPGWDCWCRTAPHLVLSDGTMRA